jgi:hypothetical protein
MTTRTRGTGLGLAIVKKIVEEHFGSMTFADREGGGAVVRLIFDQAVLAPLACDSHEINNAKRGHPNSRASGTDSHGSGSFDRRR